MPRHSLLDRYDIFVAAAVLGAHANTLSRGFRQFDIRFLLEIFTNWVDTAEEHSSLPVQNTQISRYIDALVDDGFARKLPRSGHPVYRVTRSGLIELISRVVSRTHYPHWQHLYFVVFFIEAYRTRIIQLVKMEGKRFPYSLQAELEQLLDPEVLLDRELDNAGRELKKLDKRIEEQFETQRLVDEMLEKGSEFSDIIIDVERQHPFGLNTQVRYSELFAVGTERQAVWELRVGNVKRAKAIWKPMRGLLALHIEQLEHLRATYLKEQSAKSPKRTYTEPK